MNREPSILELQKHARELAKAFKVVLIEEATRRPEQGMALTLSRLPNSFLPPKWDVVTVAPITDETGYAITLHEIGHCAHPTGSMRDIDNYDNMGIILQEEESAWEWARRYALTWTVAMQQVELLSIASYRSAAKEQAAQAAPRVKARPAVEVGRVRETLEDFLRRRK